MTCFLSPIYTSKRLAIIASLAAYLCGCAAGRAPIPPGTIPSGRYVSAEDEAYGHQVLSTITKTYPLSRSDRDIARVRGIINRLVRAGRADRHPWNVFVLEGDSVTNAAATRGNYVFVWTGMLMMAPSDDELATVLAHEMGHLLANHTQSTASERASEIMAQASGDIAGGIISMQPGYAPLAQAAAVVITEAIKAVAVNPESQRLEREADHIGFFLMADAGYDPRAALKFWRRMSENSIGGSGALSFLSSHPDSEERIEALRALLPEAISRCRDCGRGQRGSGVRYDAADNYMERDSFVVE
jgi:predicted Zn-dependent protease